MFAGSSARTEVEIQILNRDGRWWRDTNPPSAGFWSVVDDRFGLTADECGGTKKPR